ncbi:MAG: hypothetical protein L3J72_02185, partial [Thermoplasmata archaeon]|nr:hypothetical protein [Thermoplasmata archaeon]
MGEGAAAIPDGKDRRRQATVYALLAALLWSSYYLFILTLEGSVSFTALLAYPFLAGGVSYVIWAAARGEFPAFVHGFRTSGGWLRVGLFLSTQILVLQVTLSGGPVDSALLALVGDVILTPLVARAVVGEGRGLLQNPLFLLGMGLSAGGATLTILEGGSAQPIRGLSVLAAVVLPIVLAGFFVSGAGANRRQPISAVAGGAGLGAGLVSLLIAPALPGGWGGLLIAPIPLLLLVVGGVITFFVAPDLYFRAIRRSGLLLPALLMA